MYIFIVIYIVVSGWEKKDWTSTARDGDVVVDMFTFNLTMLHAGVSVLFNCVLAL